MDEDIVILVKNARGRQIVEEVGDAGIKCANLILEPGAQISAKTRMEGGLVDFVLAAMPFSQGNLLFVGADACW